MADQYLLTPFFIDRPAPGLLPLQQSGWQLNQPALPEGVPAQERLAAIYRPLADFVASTAAAGGRPVSVAGDCCTSIAVAAGLQRAGLAPTLIWFDAHGDFNTWETTPSGFLGGMPLAMLVGRGEQTIVEGVGLTPWPEERVIFSDGRDLDPGEREALVGSGLVHLEQMSDLLDEPLPEGPLWIHFDTDIVNPEEMPAMNYPAAGGPSVETTSRVFRRLAGSGQIAAVSLSSWNPELPGAERSREASMKLLAGLLA